GVPDEENGIVAFRRRRRQQVVDLEVAVRSERHAGAGCAVLAKRRGGNRAQERGEHAGARVGADAVPAAQKQAAAAYVDIAIRLYGGIEVANDPDLASGLDAADDIAVDDRGGRRGALAARDGNDADGALEFGQCGIGDSGRGDQDEDTEENGRDELHDSL